MVDHNRFIIAF